jgi:hypothetical protein
MSRFIRVLLMVFAAMFLIRFLLKMVRAKPYADPTVRGRPKSKSSAVSDEQIKDADFKDLK